MALPATKTSVRDRVSKEEWTVRTDLAALYRLVALNGWTDLIFTHISARVPGREHHFLINPYGYYFDEITASSLVKVDLGGNIVMDTPYNINPAGFVIHSAVHAAREDALFVMHTHTPYGVAVSMQKNGLLPLSQQSLPPFTTVGYHDYEGLAVNDDEKKRLVADLGPSNKLLILRNHGLLSVGFTAAEAFHCMFAMEQACRIQVLAQSTGAELITVPEPVVGRIMEQVKVVVRGEGSAIIWPGLLRKLDRIDSSFRD
jgi:ribulose-5-phosphate 4-epimerase/fuculose-1-phosphate aldolase